MAIALAPLILFAVIAILVVAGILLLVRRG